MTGQLLLRNANVITMDVPFRAEALLVEDGRIRAVGRAASDRFTKSFNDSLQFPPFARVFGNRGARCATMANRYV